MDLSASPKGESKNLINTTETGDTRRLHETEFSVCDKQDSQKKLQILTSGRINFDFKPSLKHFKSTLRPKQSHFPF